MVPVWRELGVAEAHGHAELLRLLEQRAGCRVRHFPLEPDVGLAPIFVIPARKERGERELGIDDEITTFGLGLPHQFEHAFHHHLSRLCLLHRTELGGSHLDVSHLSHSRSSLVSPTETILEPVHQPNHSTTR
jgi:hypothetical protein